MPPDQICQVCRQRLDAVAWSIGRHLGCGAYAPLNDASYERLSAHLASIVGAIFITEKERSA